MTAVNMVTITETEYKDLLKSQSKLHSLEIGGVDDWNWYDEALETFREEYPNG